MTKSNFKYIILIIFLFCIFSFQKINYISLQSTIKLFFEAVMPSLFLFILFSNLLLQLDMQNALKRIFKKNYSLIYIALIGFFCGYPMGAKAVNEYLDKKEITMPQAKFLISFANNANPVFILSTIGIAMYNNIAQGLVLAFSHYLASIIICLFFILHKNIIHESATNLNSQNNFSTKKLHKSLGELLNTAIKNTYFTLSQILAYLLLFNVLSDELSYILKTLNIPENAIYIVQGLLESTNGIKNIILNYTASTKAIMILSSFILGFSGICIIFQIYSCIYTKNISILHILKYKFIQGIISSLITYVILNYATFNLSITLNAQKYTSLSYFVVAVSLLFIFATSIKKVTRKLAS